MDLYFIALPIYAVLLVFSFVAMKLTMQEITTREQKDNDSKAKQLLQDNARKIKTEELQGEKCRIFRYLMRQHSVFAIGRGKRSLMLFFTYSIVSLYLYSASIWQISLSFGTILSLSLFLNDFVQQKKIAEPLETYTQQQISKQWTISKVLHVICGMLTITIYLTMCGLLYKNYINSRILHLISKLGIVFAVDNFGIRPVVFLLTSLMASKSIPVLSLVSKTEQQETEVTTVKVANDFGKEIETKNHFVLSLEIEPEPIDLNKPKSIKSRRTPMKDIPNISVNERNELSNQDSHQNFFSRNESSQSNLSNVAKHHQVNEIQLEKIQQCVNKDELNQYFCINLRRDKHLEENRQLQEKLETIMQNHSNIETHILPNEFVLEEFAIKSPIKIEDGNFSEKQQTCSIRNNSFCRSKASNKGIKSVRVIDKERTVEQQENYADEKDNTFIQSTKNDLSDVHLFSKDSSFVSKGRHNKASFLHINEDLKQAGELQEIDINSPNKNRKFHKSFYDTNIIPEQQIRKARRNRRRTTKVQVSQPQLITDKLIGIYCPGQNKSELDNYVTAKKKSLDRAVFFNRSNKKSLVKGRDKPIVHENDQNQADFYIPQFNFPINQ